MATWNDYKRHVRESNPEIGKDLDEVEAISQIVGVMIERRHDLELSQRDLAELCGIPHSSVARIESGKTTPNLSTLLKIFRELGLSLVALPSATSPQTDRYFYMLFLFNLYRTLSLTAQKKSRSCLIQSQLFLP